MLPDGVPTAAPIVTTLGLAVSIPLADDWRWYTEAGAASPFTSFTPSPRLVFGPTYGLTDEVSIGLAAAYQFNPGHGDIDWSHTAGASLLLGFNVSKDISLILAFGGGKNLREDGPWFVTFQPRVIFTLPW